MQLKLKCANKKRASPSEYITTPLKQHTMLSSLSHQLCSLPRQPELFEIREGPTGTLQYAQPLSTPFHVRQRFMLGLGGYGWLFNLPIWARLHHLFWLYSLLLFPSEGDVNGGARGRGARGGFADTELYERTTLIKRMQYAAAWNRCCLIRIYSSARALTAVVHTTSFPS